MLEIKKRERNKCVVLKNCKGECSSLNCEDFEIQLQYAFDIICACGYVYYLPTASCLNGKTRCTSSELSLSFQSSSHLDSSIRIVSI